MLKTYQKTFHDSKPTIYLVGTPIGNRHDLPPRAREILERVDFILAEDTRTSQKLLGTEFNQRLVPFHKFNEQKQKEKIKQWLVERKSLAIISDAGIPLISDPGAKVIEALRLELDNQFVVTAINAGPAFVHASLATGLGTENHYFHGFLKSRTANQKRLELSALIGSFHSLTTIIFYESVHRLMDTFAVLEELLPLNTEVAIARELTKVNEEITRGELKDVSNLIKSQDFNLKGEFVVLIAPQKPTAVV